jgi:hypothetical protein
MDPHGEPGAKIMKIIITAAMTNLLGIIVNIVQYALLTIWTTEPVFLTPWQ